MKKYVFVLMATMIALAGCTNLKNVDESLTDMSMTATGSEFGTLIEKARWGDGQAYLELANCYREGNGVEQDFVGMLCMLSQAEDLGSIKRMEDYLKEMPEGSEFRMIFDAIEKFEDKQIEEAISLSDQLIANGCSDGYTVKGVMAIESGDTIGGLHLMELAASQGSSFAKLLLCIPEWSNGKTQHMEMLKALSKEKPFAYTFLARLYTGEDDESMKDEHLAAQYYLKADENACLSKRGARWLLHYHQYINKLPLLERDIQRLQIIAGMNLTCQEELEVTDTIIVE